MSQKPAIERKPQFNLTPKAIAMGKQKLSEAEEAVLGLRLGVRGGGCSGVSYAVAFAQNQRENDHVFDYDGLRVFIDAKSMKILEGCILDWEDKLIGYGFKFVNPKAKSGCGCGSSFAL
ncbi:MAG: iron-sulfur cluster assembly accessory protein [Myxococcales bacterium]|nr:MAG: iron-sulfur cluster assembly accessory protein [Myxococcales bacterium]